MNKNLKLLACQIDIPQMETVFQRDQHLEFTARKLEDRLQNEFLDLVVLPELSSVDYSPATFNNLKDFAEPLKGPSYEIFRKVAMDFGVAIVYGIPRRCDSHYLITQVLVGADGEIMGYFDKLHIAHFSASTEKDYFRHGKHLFVFEYKGIRIAPIICYDIRIPELTRTLVLKHQVQLILHCGAYGRDESFYSWHHFVITRALENQVYILSLNRAGNGFGNSLFCEPWVDETTPPVEFAAFDESMIALEVKPSRIEEVRSRYSFLQDRFSDYGLL